MQYGQTIHSLSHRVDVAPSQSSLIMGISSINDILPGDPDTLLQPVTYEVQSGDTASGSWNHYDGSNWLNLAPSSVTFVNLSLPEPATWMLMLFGFGAVGWAMRRSAMNRSSPSSRAPPRTQLKSMTQGPPTKNWHRAACVRSRSGQRERNGQQWASSPKSCQSGPDEIAAVAGVTPAV
jgi:hypothetical protein